MKVSFYTNRNIPYATMCKEYRHSEPQPNTEPNTVINFGSKGVGRKVAAAFAASALLSLPLVTTRLAKNEGVTKNTAEMFGRKPKILDDIYISPNILGEELKLAKECISFITAKNNNTNKFDTLYLAQNASHSWIAKDNKENYYLVLSQYLTENSDKIARDTDNSLAQLIININELAKKPEFHNFICKEKNFIPVDAEMVEGVKLKLDSSLYNQNNNAHKAYYNKMEYIKSNDERVDYYLRTQ